MKIKIIEAIEFLVHHIIFWREIFRDVKWYESHYQVSNLWNVKTKQREVRVWKNFRTVKSIILKSVYIRKYENVFLSNGSSKRYKVHRLVAQAFLWLDINDPDVVVRHKDDKTYNNYSRNLKLWTQIQNMQDKIWKKYQKKKVSTKKKKWITRS